MSLPELFIIAVCLSMDAFAVSICKGLCLSHMNWKIAGITGLYFGGFQMAMPLIGYLLGYQFKNAITSFDHWIAFFLLGIIGLNMIRDSLKPKDEECTQCSLDPKNMILLSIATSIDALAIGVTLAFLQVQILPAISLIGITTLCLSIAGVKVGHVFGSRFQSKAEFFGGMILILMGIKILLDHLLG